MPGAVFLEGEKVNLRTVEEQDIEFIRDTFNIPEVRKNISHSEPANLEQEKEFFEQVVCGDEEVNLAISHEEEMIGMISLTPEKEQGVRQIGLWIHPDYHGNGYGTEASELMINYAFTELRVHKVLARALATNKASQSIWEKLGFEEEGKLREQAFHEGGYEDLYMYGILETEWN